MMKPSRKLAVILLCFGLVMSVRAFVMGRSIDHFHNVYEEAKTFQENGKYEKAIAGFREAAKLDPTYATVSDRLGDCLFKTKRYDEAFDAYQTVLRKNSGSSFTFLYLGEIYEMRGDQEKAKEFWSKAEESWQGDDWAEQAKSRLKKKP